MIVFDLQCAPHAHRFEGWFASSADFEGQQARGLVTCPTCASAEVTKAVMAPHVGRKGNQAPDPRPPVAAAPMPFPTTMPAPLPVANTAPPLPPEAVAMFQAIAQAQAEALKSSRWVGGEFAEKARAIHYGEEEAQPIHGQASPAEVRDLLDEGVEIAPILFPVVPPEAKN